MSRFLAWLNRRPANLDALDGVGVPDVDQAVAYRARIVAVGGFDMDDPVDAAVVDRHCARWAETGCAS